MTVAETEAPSNKGDPKLTFLPSFVSNTSSNFKVLPSAVSRCGTFYSSSFSTLNCFPAIFIIANIISPKKPMNLSNNSFVFNAYMFNDFTIIICV